MTTDPAPTRLEPTRSHVTAPEAERDSDVGGDATLLREPQSPTGATLLQDDSGGTLRESSAGDFQLSFYLAQEAAAENTTGAEERRHGARCPKFGRFVLLELLGRGGMGEVYRALHVRLRKLSAIKLLPLERAADPQARERFQREIRIISELKHPNIVRLENAGEIDGLPYLVMEYVPGLDLAQLLARLGPLPVADACQLVGQAAIGLSHIHQQGLVHRDLKPGNLILSTDGALKIADLGLARLLEGESEITAEGTLVGDPHFMAPELIDASSPADIRSDIYSLGCTLFAMLTGRPPFADAGPDPTRVLAAHLYQPFPSATEQRDGIPGGLQKILNRMTARQPSKRYASPAEVAADLAPCATGCDLIGLLRRVDIVPRNARSEAGATVDSADYLTSSGEFRSRRTSRRWLIPIACVAVGVLLTVSALTAFKLLDRPVDGDSLADATNTESGESGSVADAGSAVPADWRDATRDDIDEHAGDRDAPDDGAILGAIDPRRDAFSAEVASADEGVTFAAREHERGLLQLPVRPPEEYQLDMLVERLSGDGSFGVGVNAGSGRLLALVDHAIDGVTTMGLMHDGSGREILDQHQVQALPVGRPIRIQIVVSPTRVSLKVEDPLALNAGSSAPTSWLTSDWDGIPSRPELAQIDAYYPGVLFLHAYEGEFHLRELSISGPRDEPATMLFRSPEGSERRLAEHILWRGGRVKLLTSGGETWVASLEALPEETWIIGIDDRDVSPSLRLDDDDMRRIAETTVGLKSLDLRGCSGLTDEGLAVIDGLASLETLGLSGKGLTAAGLGRLRDLPALKNMFLLGIPLGNRLQVLTRFPTITYMCLDGCGVTDADVMEVRGAFPELQHLCLRANPVNGDCLAGLSSFPKLEELKLGQTRITDQDLPALAELPALLTVDLSQTQVSKEGVAALLEQRPELTVSR